MELDNVAVRVTDEKHDAAVWQCNRAFGNRDMQFIDSRFDGGYIRYIQCHVGIARMSFRDVHEDVIAHPGIGIEDEVDVDARGVLHDRNRFRPHRSAEKFETQLRIEFAGLCQVGNADADVVDSDYLLHSNSPVWR